MATVVAQFTTTTTNSKKAVYFLSIISYSVNKLKVYMLFTSKNLVFSNFVPENGGETGPPPAPQCLWPCVYLLWSQALKAVIFSKPILMKFFGIKVCWINYCRI